MFDKSAYLEITDFIKSKGLLTQVVSVSKNHPIEAVEHAISEGITVFGENRVQEAIGKFSQIKQKFKNIQLHLTGPLQTNKVKLALSIFDVIQTLDREKLANEFFKYPDLIKKKIFYIQVNIGNEKNKSGILSEEVDQFIKYCTNDLKIHVVGLMCIPPISKDPTMFFNELKKIASKNNLLGLSMGMSSDYKQAIETGATIVRVGTKLFGERK